MLTHTGTTEPTASSGSSAPLTTTAPIPANAVKFEEADHAIRAKYD
jgi:hypothetical protein